MQATRGSPRSQSHGRSRRPVRPGWWTVRCRSHRRSHRRSREPAVTVGVHLEREHPLVTARPSERLARVATGREPAWAVALRRSRSRSTSSTTTCSPRCCTVSPARSAASTGTPSSRHLGFEDRRLRRRQLAAGVDAEPKPEGETALRHNVDGHDLASEFDQPTPRDRGDPDRAAAARSRPRGRQASPTSREPPLSLGAGCDPTGRVRPIRAPRQPGRRREAAQGRRTGRPERGTRRGACRTVTRVGA